MLSTLLAGGLLAGCASASRTSPLPAADRRAGPTPRAGATGGSSSGEPETVVTRPVAGPTPTAGARMPNPGPLPTPGAGQLLFTRYPGLLVEQELPLVIYLPPGYHWTLGRLPAVYLLHGIGYDHQQWIELGLPELVDRQLAAGRWEPLLLIMPLMPDLLLSSTDGGPDSYEAEFLNGLVPYVERNFRADPRRSALAGISRGGVWALEIALRHPQAFAGVAALSPALHMNFPRPQYDPSVIAAEAQRFPPVIYLDAGDGEPRTRAAAQQFSALLSELGVKHTLHLGQGGHDQEYWGSVAPEALSVLVAGLADR